MVDMTYPELNADLGTNTGDGLRNVANTAANFACQLYRDSPASAIGVDPTGVGAFNNALWSKLCSPRNSLPALPPSVPFNGGQCDFNYDVTLTIVGGRPNEPFPPETRTLTNVKGPIGGVSYFRVNPNQSSLSVSLNTGQGAIALGQYGYDGFVPQVTLSVVPSNGQPDNCGNPPPSFPPNEAPLVDVETNINVDFGGLTLNVPVTFQPIISPVFNVFAPIISVNVGPINVQFEPGGVTFSPTFAPDVDITLSPSLDPRQLPPASKPPVKPDECPDVDLQPVIDKLDDLQDTADEIKECACQPDKERRVLVLPEANNRNVSVPAGEIVSARLSAVSVGGRIRGQYGGGSAPDVEFLGWCAFGRNGTGGDRKPVNYLNTYFVAPPEVTSFTYTLQDNSTATLTIEYDVPINP